MKQQVAGEETVNICADFAAQLEEVIRRHSHSQVPLISEITRYLLGEGKRIRARLAWLVGNLFVAQPTEVQRKQLLDLGCAIEFIHLATLMHDDVIDQSLLRRGQPAVHVRWGVSEAVLVGDFVYSRAFELLVALENASVLALTARATNQLAEGEVEQLVDAGRCDRSEAEYYRVIEKKTGALFGCACACAGLLGGANGQLGDRLYQMGCGIGIAFQIVDDLIDYTVEADVMGKNPGDDYREGKYTLPLILLLQRADAKQRERIAELMAHPDDAHFAELVKLMQDYQVSASCRQQVEQQFRPALALLSSLPPSQVTVQLHFEMERLLQAIQ